MAFEIRKAERRKALLRLALSGPSGSGKTLSALLIAYGITGNWSKVGVIDTENGRGELYAQTTKAGVEIGEYLYGRLLPPYSPDRYIEAIKAMEEAVGPGGVVIIDSLSHAWAGEGGILDIQGQIADRTGNGFGAWRKASPLHNKLVDTIILSNRHIIVTLRAKTEYVIESDGKTTRVTKVGLAPVQRDGLEYEFTVVLDLAHNHTAEASKDNTDIFDGKIITPSVETGRALREWLDTGKAPVTEPQREAPQSKGAAKAPKKESERPPTEAEVVLFKAAGKPEAADTQATERQWQAAIAKYAPLAKFQSYEDLLKVAADVLEFDPVDVDQIAEQHGVIPFAPEQTPSEVLDAIWQDLLRRKGLGGQRQAG